MLGHEDTENATSSCDLFPVKNVSYLCARDPSILAFGRPNMNAVKTNLIGELGEETVVTEQKQNDSSIQIYLRVKNGFDLSSLYEISENTLICNVPPNSHCMRNIKDGDALKKMYTFTKIFPPDASQKDIFQDVVKPKILDFINGQNSTLLSYGASGSGKTFTVIGTDNEPGVVPRSLEYLFRTLPQLSNNPKGKPLPTGNVSILNDCDYKAEKLMRRNLLNSSSSMDRSQHIRTYKAMQQRLSSEPVATLEETSNVSLSVWVSFAEIYNEHIYDLLQPDPPRGQQRMKLRLGCSNGHTYIKNLTNISVTSGLEAYQILQYGIHNVNYAATCLNSHSSRSHSIFTIKLVQISSADSGTYVSTFNFCDLAGCERSKKTMNVGDRLKESNNINTSLLVLGRCISAIRDSQKKIDTKLVPFRESKLTQLFQRALGGLEDIAMIVTISPKQNMFDETQHVLNFSAVAKEISIEGKQIEKPSKSRFSQLVQEKRKLTNSLVMEEEDDEEMEYFRNLALFLQNELEEQKHQHEITLKTEREYVTQAYEQIMNDMRASNDKTLKLMEEQCAVKIKHVKDYYKRLMAEKEDVITIESSDEEDDEKARELSELKEEASSLKKTVTKLQMDVEVKEQQLKKMTEEIFELRQMVDDGMQEFIELENKNKELEEVIRELRYKNVNLEMDKEALERMNGLLETCESEEDPDDQPREPLKELTSNNENVKPQSFAVTKETPIQSRHVCSDIASLKKPF